MYEDLDYEYENDLSPDDEVDCDCRLCPVTWARRLRERWQERQRRKHFRPLSAEELERQRKFFVVIAAPFENLPTLTFTERDEDAQNIPAATPVSTRQTGQSKDHD